jgi:flagellar hook-basal body complex protein FliE
MPAPIMPAIPLGPEFGIEQLGETVAPKAEPSAGFGQALSKALDNLVEMQKTSGDLAQQLATGQATDLTGVALQAEQAHLALQVAAQIRNRTVDAYHEIFRMQV